MKVSVVVPVFRVERFVGDCMRCIAQQDLAPFEVILVDDGGGDRSIAIALEEAERYGLPARVVVMDGNCGIGAARNAGARAATGDLVWFLDADDTADPRFLSTLAARIAADGSQFAMTRTLIVSTAEERIDERLDLDGVLTGREVAAALLRDELKGYACNKLLSRSLVDGHAFAEGVSYEDFDLTLAMALDSARVSLCAEPLYHYQRRAGSVSGSFSTQTFDLLRQRERVQRILDRHGASIDWRDRVRYGYVNVRLPLANMAARADDDDANARRALTLAREGIGVGDLVRLVAAGAWRLAVPAAVLRVSRRLYTVILRRR